METHGPLSRIGASRPKQVLGGNRSSLLVSIVAAALAAALIYLFVTHDQKTTTIATAPSTATVFVASSYIPAGTPEQLIAADNQFKRETVPSTQAVAGAIDDPSVVTGQVSTKAIAAGQQITSTDFSLTAKPTLASYLTGSWRGVAFNMTSYSGLTSYLQPGMRVDLMGQAKNGAEAILLEQNVEVLANSGGNVVLRLTDRQSLSVVAAEVNYTLWLSLRSDRGATQSIRIGDEEKF